MPAHREKPRSAEDIAKEDAIREHDRHFELVSKMAETAVQAGQVTVRTAVIVNGGAAVSILAFVGGLVGQGRVGSRTSRSWPIICNGSQRGSCLALGRSDRHTLRNIPTNGLWS